MENLAKTLIDELGHEKLVSLVGMPERTIRHARSVGYFAAQWYEPVMLVAAKAGVSCPLGAFNFRRLATPNGNATSDRQGVSTSREAAQ